MKYNNSPVLTADRHGVTSAVPIRCVAQASMVLPSPGFCPEISGFLFSWDVLEIFNLKTQSMLAFSLDFSEFQVVNLVIRLSVKLAS